MKKLLPILTVIVFLFALTMVSVQTVHAAGAAQETGNEVTFSEYQMLILVSILGSALVTVYRLVNEFATKRKWVVKDVYLEYAALLVSIGFAIYFYPQSIPAWPDFAGQPTDTLGSLILNYISAWLAIIVQVYIYAVAAYKVIIKAAKDKIGSTMLPEQYK